MTTERIKRVAEWIDGGCSSWGVPSNDMAVILKKYEYAIDALRGLVEVTEGTKGLPYSAAYSAAMRVLEGE